MSEKIDISDEACSVACMLVSNPQGALRQDGDGWQRRVNDLIRALRDERNRLRDFVYSIDGKTLCIRSDGNTFIDDGVVVASDIIDPR